jgi:hypothetical protein
MEEIGNYLFFSIHLFFPFPKAISRVYTSQNHRGSYNVLLKDLSIGLCIFCFVNDSMFMQTYISTCITSFFPFFRTTLRHKIKIVSGTNPQYGQVCRICLSGSN